MKLLSTIIFLFVYSFGFAQISSIPVPTIEGGNVIDFELGDDTIYAITAYNGLFLSSDNGVSWSKDEMFLSSYGTINDIAFHPSTNTLYVGVNTGLYRSTAEGGYERVETLPSFFGSYGNVQDIHITGEQTVVTYRTVTGSWSVQVSSDDMETWTEFSPVNGIGALSNSYYFELSDGTILLGDRSRIHRGGSLSGDFTEVTPDFDSFGSSIADVMEASSGSIFLASSSGIYKSEDSANSWVKTDTATLAFSVSETSEGKIFAAYGDGTLRVSEDDGETWSSIDLELNSSAFLTHHVSDMLELSDGSLLAALRRTSISGADDGAANGIIKSMDGGESWGLSNQGLFAQKVTLIDVDPENGDLLMFIETKGLYRSGDNGENWALIGDPETPDLTGLTGSLVDTPGWGNILDAPLTMGTNPATNEIWLVGDNYLFKYNRVDDSWTALQLPISIVIPRELQFFDNGVAMLTVNGGIEQGIYFSHDDGETWVPEANTQSTATTALEQVEGTLYYTKIGFTSGSFLISTDTAETYTAIVDDEGGFIPNDLIYNALQEEIYIAKPGGIDMYSINDDALTENAFGLSEATESGGPLNTDHLGISEQGDVILYGETTRNNPADDGFYILNRESEVWTKIDDEGLTNITLNDILSKEGQLYVLHDNASIRMVEGGFATSNREDIINNKPNKFRLLGNFPNPFNPTTNIQFELPEQSSMSFKVFNVMGQKVHQTELRFSAGTHTLSFDASKFSSGIYFYQLSNEVDAITGKMMLIK